MVTAIKGAKYVIFVVDWSFHPLFIPVRSGKPKVEDSIGAILLRAARDNPELVVGIHTWDHTSTGAHDPANDEGEAILKQIARESKGIDFEKLYGNRFVWRASSRDTSNSMYESVRKGLQGDGLGVLSGALAGVGRARSAVWSVLQDHLGWSHHQKFVVCDVDVGPGQKRELKVFFGGLDFTKGRFDWKEHHVSSRPPTPPVVASLQTPWELSSETQQEQKYQSNEWYNPEFADKLSMPRQPWHDVQAALQGPSAWKFIQEFVGRWTRNSSRLYSSGIQPGFEQSPPKAFPSPPVPLSTSLSSDTDPIWKHYVKMRRRWVKQLVQPDEPVRPPRGPWRTTVCRSIKKSHWAVVSRAHADLAKDFEMQADYEMSIQSAYLSAIESAQHFIYIETQYFVGSSERWFEKSKHFKNDIPGKIVETIIRRFTADKKTSFHAYIVLPMLPEGRPTGGLRFQWDSAARLAATSDTQSTRRLLWKTIEYMVVTLDRELKKIDPSLKWKDCLSFYFLANWTKKNRNAWVKSGWSSVSAEELERRQQEVQKLQKQLGAARQRQHQLFLDLQKSTEPFRSSDHARYAGLTLEQLDGINKSLEEVKAEHNKLVRRADELDRRAMAHAEDWSKLYTKLKAKGEVLPATVSDWRNQVLGDIALEKSRIINALQEQQREYLRQQARHPGLSRAALQQHHQKFEEARKRTQGIRAEQLKLVGEMDRLETSIRDILVEIEKLIKSMRDGERNRETRVREHERYMVYVHSKLMIVDDTQLLLGSANLNERSLAGNRDTEIVCWLRPSSSEDTKSCMEKIRGFRMNQLWEEHFGGLKALPAKSEEPHSRECVNAVREKGDANYFGFRSMSAAPVGHLCRWPFTIVGNRLDLQHEREDGSKPPPFPESANLIPDAGSEDEPWKWSVPGVSIEGMTADKSG
ncbi:hypothetical protein F0U62_21285 [Cystobacter fuscus]|nr:hypothetical protein F0U62_21285 [Cystobacter fuscus]